MARGVRYLRTKTIVKLVALEMFLQDFRAEEMIEALVALTEFAVTHPQFATRGNPGADEWMLADEATDALLNFFEHDYEAPDDGTGAPKVVLDQRQGAIELLKPRIRRRRSEPSLADATDPVRPRIMQRRHVLN